jgi:tRNA (guanine-N7-)-methyltransferase
MSIEQKRKHIKSFVLRQGKITPGQSNSIEELMPIYGIKYSNSPIDLNAEFKRVNHKIIEIGFGMGNASWQIAKSHPENDYLGIEVHSPGVGSLLMSLKSNEVSNLRIIHHDALEVLHNMIPNGSINGFHIYFPDPWHKKRHHKRRIIQEDFINLLCQKLVPGGYIHLATDWEHYSTWMLDILNKNPQLHNESQNNTFIARPDFRPMTKFEQRGINLGHKVWDLMFKKID